MAALQNLWHWLHTKTTQAIAGPGSADTNASGTAVDTCSQNDYIGPEKDLRAARQELLRHETWRSRAGPWQLK